MREQDVREQVVKTLEQCPEPLKRIDAILLVGDIAFSAKSEEYEEAFDWIERLRSICGCPRSSVLTVPGNHDVERSKVRKSARMAYERLRQSNSHESEHALQELLAETDFDAPLANYQSFASAYGTPFRNGSGRWIREFNIDQDRVIAFIGLNSARISDALDAQNGMFLGKDLYTIPDRHCVEQVVLMHHPTEWLRDRTDAEAMLDTRSRMSIFGHEHVQRLTKVEAFPGTSRAQERLILGSGAVTPDEIGGRYIYRFNILEFSHTEVRNSQKFCVTVHPYVWDFGQQSFIADLNANNGRAPTIQLRSKRWTPPLSRGTAPVDAQPLVTSAPLTESDLRHEFWRRLDWKKRIAVLRQAGAQNLHSHPLKCEDEHQAFETALNATGAERLLSLVRSQSEGES